MEVIQQLLPAGHPNRPGTKLEALKAIIVHYTANEDPGATDTANIKYIGRAWQDGVYWDITKKALVSGIIEYGSASAKNVPADYLAAHPDAKAGVAFRYGSAHVFADNDSISQAIPLDEVAWACGDRPLAWTPLNKGQQQAARLIFGNRQNYQSLSVEICNNDVVPGNKDWLAAAGHAQEWIAAMLKARGLRIDLDSSLDPQHFKAMKPGDILLLRHFDVSGKICPKPFIEVPKDWSDFILQVNAML